MKIKRKEEKRNGSRFIKKRVIAQCAKGNDLIRELLSDSSSRRGFYNRYLKCLLVHPAVRKNNLLVLSG